MEGGLPKLTRQQMHATFSLGATGIFLYNICFFAALERMPAGRSALFVALNPIVTALALALLFGERLGFKKWLGIAIAFVGAAIVITRGELLSAAHDISASLGSGELFMLTAVCAWAAYTIIGRHALKGLSPIAATTYASLWGLLLLTCGALFQLPQLDRSHLTLPVLAAIAYLGVFGTVIGFVWYYEGVKKIADLRERVNAIALTDTSKVFNTARIEALEVENLIECAQATMVSAAARKECRGAHTVSDYERPADDPITPLGRDDANWMKHTLWHSDTNSLTYKPVNLKPLTVDSVPPKVRTF